MNHLIVGNWKMNHTVAQTEAYAVSLLALQATLPENVDVAIAPPFTALPQASARLRGTRFALASQNVHWSLEGAFTGEISPIMLAELGVRYAIVGHSERRAYFGETDEMVRKRVGGALEAGIAPIVCVGESLDERSDGRAYARVTEQTRAALAGLSDDAVATVTMAYEPIWAIGTGKNCDPAEADRTMGVIRESVSGLASSRVLYGGSVKPENVVAYAAQPNVGGALVGGASLDPSTFVELIRNAAEGLPRA